MDKTGVRLIMLSVGMFVMTFLMGFIPTKINASKKVMNLISIVGAGLLVGVAFIVIVPEGMETLFKALMQDKA